MSICIFPTHRHQMHLFSSPAGASLPPLSALTRFAEVPIDPDWPAKIRATLEAQPDEFFRHHFGGRLPTPAERRACIEDSIAPLTPIRAFENNLYRVEIKHTPAFMPLFVHLAIRRHDWMPCTEWAHLQWVKNEIMGPEHEAVELFPAESRLVNTANEYHLWVHSDPRYRFPIGWTKRHVLSKPVKVAQLST